MGRAPPPREQPPISSPRIGCSGVAKGGSSSRSARSSEPQPMTTGLVHPRPPAAATSPGIVAHRRVGPAGAGWSRMRQVASPLSSPSDTSSLLPLRRGPAPGPPFPPVSLRLPPSPGRKGCSTLSARASAAAWRPRPYGGAAGAAPRETLCVRPVQGHGPAPQPPHAG